MPITACCFTCVSVALSLVIGRPCAECVNNAEVPSIRQAGGGSLWASPHFRLEKLVQTNLLHFLQQKNNYFPVYCSVNSQVKLVPFYHRYQYLSIACIVI